MKNFISSVLSFFFFFRYLQKLGMISLLYSKKKNLLVLNKIESFYHTEMAEFEASFSAMEIVQLCQELNSVTYLFKKIKCSHLRRNLSQD